MLQIPIDVQTLLLEIGTLKIYCPLAGRQVN